ncbi:hypothetical protein AcV7_005018 [Taiwanofungus camphoratus]|nr:hypothetical protein AcV7_005018 [Antrodia cinnamomea]
MKHFYYIYNALFSASTARTSSAEILVCRAKSGHCRGKLRTCDTFATLANVASRFIPPNKPQSGSLQNFSSRSSTPSSRDELGLDLVDRVTYNAHCVEERLAGTVAQSTLQFADDMARVVKSVRARDLRLAMLQDIARSRGVEEDMYDPLAAQLSPHPSSTVCRYVGSIDHYPYDGNVGIPLQRPDFILAGTAPPNTTADNPELTDGIDPSSMLWRQAISFIEVKPDNAEGPYRGRRTRGKKVAIRLLAQAADHARVILRARVRSSSTLSA